MWRNVRDLNYVILAKIAEDINRIHHDALLSADLLVIDILFQNETKHLAVDALFVQTVVPEHCLVISDLLRFLLTVNSINPLTRDKSYYHFICLSLFPFEPLQKARDIRIIVICRWLFR